MDLSWLFMHTIIFIDYLFDAYLREQCSDNLKSLFQVMLYYYFVFFCVVYFQLLAVN